MKAIVSKRMKVVFEKGNAYILSLSIKKIHFVVHVNSAMPRCSFRRFISFIVLITVCMENKKTLIIHPLRKRQTIEFIHKTEI